MDYLEVCGLSVQEFGDISVIVLLLIFSLSSQNINRIIKIILHLLRYVLWPTLWCFPEKAMAPHSSALAWKNPMDGGAWRAAVHGVAESPARLSDFTFPFHFHSLAKEMATHSSILAWRIPGTEEPGRLLSMGLHRVGHD